MRNTKSPFAIFRTSLIISILLFQQFMPILAYAQDTDNIDTGEITPTITQEVDVITPEVTPTPTIVEDNKLTDNTEIVLPVKNNMPSLDDLSSTTKTDPFAGLNIVGKTQKFTNIQTGVKYTYTFDANLTISFDLLPEGANWFTIEEKTVEVGEDSVTGYDFQTNMINGTFKYDLELPNAQGQNAEVKYSEDGVNFVDVENEEVSADTVNVSENHFTIFVVIAPNPVASNCSDAGFAVSVGDLCYNTIQEAINASVNGDTIMIGVGTFTPTSTINVNKEVTIQGAGQASTIIDGSSMAGSSYGMYVTASNVTLSNFTFQNAKSYGLKISGNNNINVNNVTVTNSARSNIDFNGTDNITVFNVTATGTPYGVGIAVTDGIGGTFTNITTSGNAWAGMAFYTSTYYPPAGVADMAISGSNSFGEPVVYYTEGTSFTNITYSPVDYLYSYSPIPGFTAYALRLDAPTHLGWNTALKSVTPNEMPIDLACSLTPLTTNENSVAMNWTAVTGANIKYQREVTFPNSTISYFYNTPNYTTFSSFGGGAGTQGLWGTRVRAYTDLNGNNAIDAGENTSNWSNLCQIRYDITAPSAPTITAPTGDYYNSSPILNAWTAVSDDSGIKEYRIEYAYDDGHTFSGFPYRTSTTNSRNHTPSLAEQGGVQFRVQALDNAGNYGAWSTWKHYFYDATAPIITIINPGTTPATSKTITASSNEGSLTMFVNPVGVTTCDSTLGFVAYSSTIFSAEADNGKTVCYKAVDLASNTTYLLSDVIGGIDRTRPVANVVNPFDGQNINGQVVININATDALSGVTTVRMNLYKVGTPDTLVAGCTGMNFTYDSVGGLWTLTINNGGACNLTDDTYRIASWAIDAAGNTVYPTRPTFVIDSVFPIITINNPTTSPAKLKTITASTDEGTFEMAINPVGLSTCDNTLTFSAYADITFSAESDNGRTVCYKAYDLAGNTTYSISSAIAGIDLTKPTVSVVSPLEGAKFNGSVLIQLLAIDNPSGIASASMHIYRVGTPDVLVTGCTTLPTAFNAVTGYWETTINNGGSCNLTEGTYKIAAWAYDNAGNVNWASRPTFILDTTAPVITVSNQTVQATSAAGAIVNYPATANDTVDGAITPICAPVSSILFPIGNTTVNCTATDMAGNVGNASFIVKVEDTTAPTVPSNIHFNNPALTCGAYTNVGSNTVDWDDSSDAVGVTGYDYYIEYPLISGGRGTWNTTTVASQRFGTLNPGLHQLKVRAYDAAGNKSDWTALCDITYDNVAPVITLIGANPQHVELNTTYIESGATALDNFNGDLTASIVIDASAVANTSVAGNYTVTYNVSDLAGNAATVQTTRTVEVSDTIAPVTTDSGIDGEWHNTDVIVTLTCTDLNGIGCDKTYYSLDSGATWTEGNSITFSADGIYNIMYYSIDIATNAETPKTASDSVKIDKTGPVITVPADFTLEATSPSGRENVTYTVTAEDAMTGSVPVDCTPVSGSTLSLGGHLITCTASDESGVPTSETLVVGTGTPTATPTATPIVVPITGNTTTTTFNITIVDTTAPIITLNGANPINLAYGATYTEFGATASDIVDTDVPVTLTGSVNTSVAGTYTITYNASDDSGNAATPVTRTVIVAAQVIQPQVNNGNGGNVQGEATTPTPTVTPTEEVEDGRVLGLTDQKCDTKYETSGYVYVDSNNNGVKDDGEKMLNNVEVIIYLSKVKQDDGSYKDMDIVRVTTDDNGKWSTKVCEGDYKLTVDSNDLPSNTKNNTGSLDLKVKGASTNENFNIAIVETATAGFNWWILFIIGAVGGAIVYFVRRSSNKDQQLSYK